MDRGERAKLYVDRATAQALNGSYHAARADLEKAIALDKDNILAHNNYAWLLATCSDGTLRDGVQAVQHAERACQLTGFRHSITISTLAAAYAEAGRYPEAVRTAESALRMQTANGENALAALNQQLLSLYRAGKPYHQTSLP